MNFKYHDFKPNLKRRQNARIPLKLSHFIYCCDVRYRDGGTDGNLIKRILQTIRGKKNVASEPEYRPRNDEQASSVLVDYSILLTSEPRQNQAEYPGTRKGSHTTNHRPSQPMHSGREISQIFIQDHNRCN